MFFGKGESPSYGALMLPADLEKSDSKAMSAAGMGDLAYERIRKAIINNILPPGAKIIESEMAHSLGVSRTPIREALSRLLREGLVETIGMRGVRVSLLRSNELKEVYEVLTAFEAQAVSLLAKKKLKERRPAMAAMQAALSGMEEALEKNELSSWSDFDGHFHYAFLEGGGNTRLTHMAATEIEIGRRSRIYTLHSRTNLEKSNIEHKYIFNAIREGEPEEARQTIIKHRERTTKIIVSLLQELENRTL